MSEAEAREALRAHWGGGGPLPSQNEVRPGGNGGEGDKAAAVKPNLATSGLLAAESNTVNGVVLKYVEPDDAAVPKKKWVLFVFDDDGDDDGATAPLYVCSQSHFLVGSDPRVAHVVVGHQTVAPQHAVLQHRRVRVTKAGDAPDVIRTTVKPYIIDLNSAGGTFVNGDRVPPAKYYELRAKDVITLGTAPTEYVLVNSKAAKG